jgi:pyruvate/2-oxoglutarate dehydrogenase complex dihydrolipoamide dehydrogenase (E3) component
MWLATSDHMAIPQVIFTDPQIGSVGLTEESARALKINVRAVASEIGTLPGAQLHTDGYDGQAKIVVDEDRHVMVGATFIGYWSTGWRFAPFCHNCYCRSSTIRAALARHTIISYCE